IGAADDVGAQPLPAALIGGADDDVAAAGAKGLVRRRDPMPAAGRARYGAVGEERCRLPDEPRQAALRQGDVDVLPLAGTHLVDASREDRVDRGDAGADVVD